MRFLAAVALSFCAATARAQYYGAVTGAGQLTSLSVTGGSVLSTTTVLQTLYVGQGAAISTMTGAGVAAPSVNVGVTHTGLAPLDVVATGVYPTVSARFGYNGLGSDIYISPDMGDSDAGLIANGPLSLNYNHDFVIREGLGWTGSSFSGNYNFFALGLDANGFMGLDSPINPFVSTYPDNLTIEGDFQWGAGVTKSTGAADGSLHVAGPVYATAFNGPVSVATNTWVNGTVSRALNTIYQNTGAQSGTGSKFVTASVTFDATGAACECYIGAASPPTGLVSDIASGGTVSGMTSSVTFIVPPAWYYECTTAGSVTLSTWAEWY